MLYLPFWHWCISFFRPLQPKSGHASFSSSHLDLPNKYDNSWFESWEHTQKEKCIKPLWSEIYITHMVISISYTLEKQLFHSYEVQKTKEKRFFEIWWWPFEPQANYHSQYCQLGWIWWCILAQLSKVHHQISKIFNNELFHKNLKCILTWSITLCFY